MIYFTSDKKHNVPVNLLKAIGKQNPARSNTVSRSGAQGVMQQCQKQQST